MKNGSGGLWKWGLNTAFMWFHFMKICFRVGNFLHLKTKHCNFAAPFHPSRRAVIICKQQFSISFEITNETLQKNHFNYIFPTKFCTLLFLYIPLQPHKRSAGDANGEKNCLLDIFAFSLENYLLSRFHVHNLLLFSWFSHTSSAFFSLSGFCKSQIFPLLVNFLLLWFFFSYVLGRCWDISSVIRVLHVRLWWASLSSFVQLTAAEFFVR